ncbi:MAG: nucleoside triphosphate pyrophosphohydrolase [Alphaproteobacteria bacterium]
MASAPSSLESQSASAIDRLISIMAQLRNPKTGCPWDVAQDFASIAPYTIEEAYEVAEAIAQKDMEALQEELGDLLLQVVFHARMAEEAGLFAFDHVVEGLVDKLIRRHPHVFGDSVGRNQDIHKIWEEAKTAERAAKALKTGASAKMPSILDGVALALPALTRAEKLQNRAAKVGFDWPSPVQVLDKIEEEIGELRAALSQSGADGSQAAIHEEFGDLLFAIVNLGRWLKIDSEQSLRDCNQKFINRFNYIEENIDFNKKTPSLGEMEALWQEAKKIYKK